MTAIAVVATVLWPLAAFFAGGADLSAWAAAPYLRTLALSLLVALGAFALGLPAAWALAAGGRLSGLLRALAVAVLLVPPYLAASAWLGLAWRAGLVELAQDAMALLPETSQNFMGGGNLFCAALVMAMSLWPCVALPAAAALAELGRSEREAALLARGRRGPLRAVELPAALPAAAAGAVLACALCWAEVGAPDLFVLDTAARDVLRGFERSHDYSMAAGRALPFLPLAALAAAFLAWLWSRPRSAELPRAQLAPLPGAPRAALWTAAVLTLSLGAVLAGLAANARSMAMVGPALAGAPAMLGRTLLLAFLSSVTALLLGGALVWALAASGSRWPLAVALAALSLGLIVPGTLWGLGCKRVCEAAAGTGVAGDALAAFLDSPAALIWAGAARAAFASAAIVAWGLRRVDPQLFEAARTAGLGLWSRALLAAGLLRRQLAAALLVGVALAIGEIGASVMIVPPGWCTLSVWVFNAMHYGHGEATAALALVAGAGAVLFGLAAAAAAGRKHEVK
jgi:iron(III) transport system permease protein